MLRPSKEEPKEFGFQGKRWRDLAEEDGHGPECSEEELQEFIRERQLPHWNRDLHKPEAAVPAHPEIGECVDPLMMEGEALARKGKGRASLPWQGKECLMCYEW